MGNFPKTKKVCRNFLITDNQDDDLSQSICFDYSNDFENCAASSN